MREPALKRRKLSASEEGNHADSITTPAANSSRNKNTLKGRKAGVNQASHLSGTRLDNAEKQNKGRNAVGSGKNEVVSSEEDEEDVSEVSAIWSDQSEGTSSGDEDISSIPPKTMKTNKKPRIQQNGDSQGVTPFAGSSFKSNVFKLQVDNLLKQVRQKHQLKDKSIEQALRALKAVIEGIPARGPTSVTDAETALRKLDGVAIPFPYPKPPSDANYKLEYAKPAHINTVGSFPLKTGIKTATKTGDDIVIDLVLMMPSEIFQEKDYLNHRYFYKRAFYLACIAAGIKADKTQSYKLSFDNLHGNQLLPVLIVEINKENYSNHGLPSSTLKIVILPSIQENTFVKEKLFPNRNCVRMKGSSEALSVKPLPATPFYNASLRADSLISPYLELQYETGRTCEAYKDACVLGRIWLRQRGFNSRIPGGGFGNFEWAVLVALLLRGGGTNGQPAFASGYSSYQLFKATLQYLASKDLTKSTPDLTLESGEESLNGTPVFYDQRRCLNVLFKMTPWSYKLLQHEARSSVAMLSDSTFDHFDSTFIIRSDRPLYRSDVIIKLPLHSIIDVASVDDTVRLRRCLDIYDKLSQGLDNRVKLINLTHPENTTWDTSSTNPAELPILTIGFLIDPEHAHRLVDHGPPAENKLEAARFRKFWGEKAELRRYRDGSILESVIWTSSGSAGHSVFKQVVSYIVEKHVGKDCLDGMAYFGDEESSVLSSTAMSMASTTQVFKPIMEAFRTLEKDLRGLEDIPLQIRHLLTSGPQLTYSSVKVPFIPGTTTMTDPADVVLQFEGSARWPDDLDAIQRTKMAFSLKIAESLQSMVSEVSARVALENEDSPLVNQCCLVVVYTSGAAFRIRIHHDREITLLERQLKDKSLSNMERAEVAEAMAAYKRIFIKKPAHAQALQTLSTRFPAFSGTVRLLTNWFSTHLLSNHFSPYLISLFAARAFSNPYPWNPPSSPQAGFLRVLLFLSRWDWRGEPWIVDLGSDMRSADVETLTTRFEAWRKIDPASNRVILFAASNIDGDGNTWTDNGRPAKVVAGRLSALARAAVELINTQGINMDFRDLFHGSLEEYDVVIYINQAADRSRRNSKTPKPQYKNLALQSTNPTLNIDTIGFSPAKLFLADLERVFGNAILFFFEECQGDVITGLWNPLNEKRDWKLSLGYSAVPLNGEDGGITARMNKEGILHEIARLGGDLVKKIEVGRSAG